MRAIQRLGMGLEILGSGGDGYDKLLCAEGFPFQHVAMGKEPLWKLDDAALLVRLHRRFRETQPTIVHSFTARPAVFGTLAAASASVPGRVVTITGLGHAFTTAGPGMRTAVTTLYRVALHAADVVFFQNKDDQALFVDRKLVLSDRTRLVPGSGVDLEKFVPKPLPCLSTKTTTVLMLARVLREKGVHEYFAAAKRLKGHRQLRFRLVGGVDVRNPSSLSRDEAGRLARDAGVEWIDHVSDVRPFIEEADLVVLPSYREGLPRSLLEAAAMGRPLVTTDAPGCREVVEDGFNGYLVPVANADALASAIEAISDNPSLMGQMGQNSRSLVEKRFDQQIVIERTLRAYQNLLSAKLGYAQPVGVSAVNSVHHD